MNNRDIDAFFEQHGLAGRVEKQVRPPNEAWTLRAAGFPVLIQTQENANRMRIVAFIAEAADQDAEMLAALLSANYHTALDARYALADDAVVAVFLHPFRELDLEQFVLGFYQVISCAETCGSEFSGGTLTFGAADNQGNGAPRRAGVAESQVEYFTQALVKKIAGL